MSDERTWDDTEGVPAGSTTAYTAVDTGGVSRFPPGTARCEHCDRDLWDLANADGRGDELGPAVVYWCPDCAARQGRRDWPADPAYQSVGHLGRGLHDTWLMWQPATGRVLAGRQIGFWKRHEENTRRYIEEVQPLLRLAHPHLSRLLDVHASPAGLLVTSAYVPGENLWSYVTRPGRVPSARLAVEVARGLLDGLGQIHALGITHANIHPWNILLPEGALRRARICLASRGFSYELDTFDPEAYEEPLPTEEHVIAATFGGAERLAGLYGGTPAADLYAMAQVLYLLLTGELVLNLPLRSIRKADFVQLMNLLHHGQPVPVRTRRPDLPAELAQVVDRAVSRDAAERFQRVEEFVAALEAVP